MKKIKRILLSRKFHVFLIGNIFLPIKLITPEIWLSLCFLYVSANITDKFLENKKDK